jgi:hypothetical protein
MADNKDAKLRWLKGRFGDFLKDLSSTFDSINRLKGLIDNFDYNIAEILEILSNSIWKQDHWKMNSSDLTKADLSSYLEHLESMMTFLNEDKEQCEEEIKSLLTPDPPPPTPEETDSKTRIMVHQTNVEVFSKLRPVLVGTAEDLRKGINGEDCSSYVLLQKIFSILNLDDQEAVSRIIGYFKDKTKEQILSDHGLVIILAVSNIAGYSEEYERSMKGTFYSDDWMFDELFAEEPKFGLVSFPSLVYRAFEHPFIQEKLLSENKLSENFKTSLRYINDFSRRLHNPSYRVLLTMDSLSLSDPSMLYAGGFFLHVHDIWRVLESL